MNDRLSELANLELSREETREILRRLAIDEFGGSEHPRVGDIAELAGTPPEVIGRMLADMRGETNAGWKVQVEDVLDRHSKDIERLRQAAERAAYVSDYEVRDRLERERGHKATFRPFTKKERERILTFLAFAAFAIAFLYFFLSAIGS